MERTFSISRLTDAHTEPYRALRLWSLRLQPDAFGASFEEESALPEAAFAERLKNGEIFGAWTQSQLGGCVGLVGREKSKLRHKASLWGMFVRPEHRGKGVGRDLLNKALASAADLYEEVLLTVVEGNRAALDLYVSAGFEEYGREPRTIRLGTKYYDEILMRLPFPNGSKA